MRRLRSTMLVGGMAVAAALLACCGNPFATMESDFASKLPAENRLRSIQRFSLADYERPEEAESAERDPSFDPYEGLEQVEMTLEEARASVLENNLDLQVALVNPTIAAQSVREEEGRFDAIFRPNFRYSEDDSPTFNVSTAAQQQFFSGNLGVDIPLRTGGRASVDLSQTYNRTANPFVVFPETYQSSVRFSVSHELLRNAGRRTNTFGIRVADINQRSSESQTKLEVIRQLAGVDRAYWRLDAVRRELIVRQQQYELAVVQLERARRLFQAGDVAQIEVIRAEAGVAERLEAIINAENAVRDRQREFKRIINRAGLEMESARIVIPTSEPDPIRYVFDPVELADAAMGTRMELLQLELQLLSDLSTIEFNENQTLPLLSLDYAYTIAGLGESFNAGWRQVRDNNFESWTVGLSGSIPIGNESAKARLRSAILTRLQRLSTREAQRLAIRQEIFNAVDQVEANWQRILAARQSAIAAARAFEAEENQLGAGASTVQDVLDQASRLADAQSAEIRAIAEYQIALVDIAFATGTILGASKVEWAPTGGDVQ